ncbi:MAG TPA: chloride channel protein [Cellvibrio sp.]|nr:chloride channel protein [Cellvibrio sp.]
MTRDAQSSKLVGQKSPWQKRVEGWRNQLSGSGGLPQLTLLGIFTGIFAGAVIVLFRLAVEIPLSALLPGSSENFEALAGHWHFLLPLLGAIALAIPLHFVDKKHQGAGVAYVLDRLHNHQAHIPPGNFLYQFFAGGWCLLSGQSVGREGPAVHLGASSGSLLGQWLHLPNNSLRSLAGCGVAAAIAACFNTPLAGVIFAMEVVVMEYSISGFIPVILAAVAGTTITQLVFGSDTVFHPPQASLKSLTELPFIIFAGFVVALFAALFIRLQSYCCKASCNRPVLLRFTVAGLITACGALAAPQIMGVGYDTIDSALNGNIGLWLLLSILLVKLLVSGVSLGLGIPGGVIGPLLLTGACIGGATGIIANQIMPGNASNPGFYALLGMGAMMGAVLNAPLAAIMTLLELTYNPNIIFPSMLVIIVACLITREVFACEGLFQTLLKVQGKKNSFSATEHLLSRTGARSLLDRHIQTSGNIISLAQAHQLLAQHPHWIVLDEKKCLLRPGDLASHISRFSDDSSATPDTLLDLLTIPAQRLDMIELDDRINLYQALLSMNLAQVDAAFIGDPHKPGLGILTREHIDNYYKV